jgi:hypothetical protein
MTLDTETHGLLLGGLGLTVMLLAALLVTTWGRD